MSKMKKPVWPVRSNFQTNNSKWYALVRREFTQIFVQLLSARRRFSAEERKNYLCNNDHFLHLHQGGYDVSVRMKGFKREA